MLSCWPRMFHQVGVTSKTYARKNGLANSISDDFSVEVISTVWHSMSFCEF